MEIGEMFLALAVGLAVYFIGYLKGLHAGMDWGLENLRDVHKDIQRINNELLRRQDAQ